VVQVMEGRHCFAHLTVEEIPHRRLYAQPGRAQLKRDLERVYGYFSAAEGAAQRASPVTPRGASSR